jgi:hypothetical protein
MQVSLTDNDERVQVDCSRLRVSASDSSEARYRHLVSIILLQDSSVILKVSTI